MLVECQISHQYFYKMISDEDKLVSCRFDEIYINYSGMFEKKLLKFKLPLCLFFYKSYFNEVMKMQR